MSLLKNLIVKNKFILLYLIFGGLTTLINISAFALLYKAGVPNVAANVIAWILAVVFAFFTNKIFVFQNKTNSVKSFCVQLGKFFMARIATGILDVAAMYILVDVIELNAFICKVICSGTVIVLNFFISKFMVFKKNAK